MARGGPHDAMNRVGEREDGTPNQSGLVSVITSQNVSSRQMSSSRVSSSHRRAARASGPASYRQPLIPGTSAPFHHQVDASVSIVDVARRLMPELIFAELDRCLPGFARVIRTDDHQVGSWPRT